MIPRSHPRYESLILREKVADGVRKGLVHITGLIAHGRGEAFDYLIGEKTTDFAERAAEAAAAYLKVAKNPVISVNGNTAVLSGKEIVKLADETKAKIEVNLFHRSEERIKKLIDLLKKYGGKEILGMEGDAILEGLEHDRAICSKEGIYKADVVLVPLEDGDRCEVLKKMGKVVLTVDLNPLSRTARMADVTIVDNITRAIPNIRKAYRKIEDYEKILEKWDNEENLRNAVKYICNRLKKLF